MCRSSRGNQRGEVPTLGKGTVQRRWRKTTDNQIVSGCNKQWDRRGRTKGAAMEMTMAREGASEGLFPL